MKVRTQSQDWDKKPYWFQFLCNNRKGLGILLECHLKSGFIGLQKWCDTSSRSHQVFPKPEKFRHLYKNWSLSIRTACKFLFDTVSDMRMEEKFYIGYLLNKSDVQIQEAGLPWRELFIWIQSLEDNLGHAKKFMQGLVNEQDVGKLLM